jgi:hypothetical protein
MTTKHDPSFESVWHSVMMSRLVGLLLPTDLGTALTNGRRPTRLAHPEISQKVRNYALPGMKAMFIAYNTSYTQCALTSAR